MRKPKINIKRENHLYMGNRVIIKIKLTIKCLETIILNIIWMKSIKSIFMMLESPNLVWQQSRILKENCGLTT